MSESTPLRKETVEKIVPLLLQASGLIDEAVAIVDRECTAQVSEEFKHRIASAMATIGWDVLEQMIYVRYPALRPYEINT